MKVLHADNAGFLVGKRVAILGYGNQGRAQALNLRDSGIDVVIGQRPGKSYDRAVVEGFRPVSVSDASGCDVVMFTLPDEYAGDIYATEISTRVHSGQTLLFTHGFNVHYGYIQPPSDLNVALVAPKGQARAVRDAYLAGTGVPGLVAVHHNADGGALDCALAYAYAAGYGRKLLIETTFREETETDLFGEQAVLCGGMIDLMVAGFETLIQAGYAPEMAYFECVHETKLIIDLMLEKGLTAMREGISDTAEWGGYLTGPKLVTDETRTKMREILRDIQTGHFADGWIAEARSGKPNLKQLSHQAAQGEVHRISEELRSVLNR